LAFADGTGFLLLGEEFPLANVVVTAVHLDTSDRRLLGSPGELFNLAPVPQGGVNHSHLADALVKLTPRDLNISVDEGQGGLSALKELLLLLFEVQFVRRFLLFVHFVELGLSSLDKLKALKDLLRVVVGES